MKKQAKSQGISTRILIIAVVCILVLSVAALLLLRQYLPAGKQVVVTVNGEPFGSYPLNRNQTVTIHPEGGSWHNILQIQDGQANMIESDCDNQICVLTPPISEESLFPIVCLPHGVAVELK